MPTAPPRHNAHKVKANRAVSQKEYTRTKRTNQSFYDSTAWRKLRNWHVLNNPLCEECKSNGRATSVQVVDHIIELKDGGAPLDASNLRSLCHAHHNTKTAQAKAERDSVK